MIIKLLLLWHFVSGVFSQDTLVLSGIIRDQAPNTMNQCGTAGTANGGQGFVGTDFQLPFSDYQPGERGLVGLECNAQNGYYPPMCGTIGADDTPEYRYPGQSPGRSVQSPASFFTWFHNSDQTINIPINLVLTRDGESGVYRYNNRSFFPIDGMGWMDRCNNHNFAFCLEVHSQFFYSGGEVFDFTGDDDVWVYLDDRLAIDLGGVHGSESKSIRLDSFEGLVVGNNYRFDFFFCERHTTQSNLVISTTIAFTCQYYDRCGVCNGNGLSCCGVGEINSTYCTDNNACTVDTCDRQSSETNGCNSEPISCNDENPCTSDSCDPTQGCTNAPISCDDGNVCTTDSCNAESGCVNTPIESCEGGCTSSSCNDGNPCTTDTCDAESGNCVYTPRCDDGNVCTTDSCDSESGACVNMPISNCEGGGGCSNSSCNDGNPCTADTCDAESGNCVYTPRCDDGNICTTDSCDSESGACVNTPIEYSCDDGNACTTESCDAESGNCVYSPISCDDGNACTSDSCDTQVGCINTAISCSGHCGEYSNTTCDPQYGCGRYGGSWTQVMQDAWKEKGAWYSQWRVSFESGDLPLYNLHFDMPQVRHIWGINKRNDKFVLPPCMYDNSGTLYTHSTFSFEYIIKGLHKCHPAIWEDICQPSREYCEVSAHTNLLNIWVERDDEGNNVGKRGYRDDESGDDESGDDESDGDESDDEDDEDEEDGDKRYYQRGVIVADNDDERIAIRARLKIKFAKDARIEKFWNMNNPPERLDDRTFLFDCPLHNLYSGHREETCGYIVSHKKLYGGRAKVYNVEASCL